MLTKALAQAREHQELANIYVGRGLDSELADAVARQLMDHDALGAHARDELGISDVVQSRPIQAAVSSAASFAAGAALPMVAVLASPLALIPTITTVTSLVALALLGALSAYTGGAAIGRAILRLTIWGAMAMAATAAVGAMFGTTVA